MKIFSCLLNVVIFKNLQNINRAVISRTQTDLFWRVSKTLYYEGIQLFDNEIINSKLLGESCVENLLETGDIEMHVAYSFFSLFLLYQEIALQWERPVSVFTI